MNNPAIDLVRHTADQSAQDRAIDQPQYGMRPFLEKLNKFRHCGRAASSESGNTQHELVLLWSHVAPPRGAFAEAEKLTKGIAKLGQVMDYFIAGCRGAGKRRLRLRFISHYDLK